MISLMFLSMFTSISDPDMPELIDSFDNAINEAFLQCIIIAKNLEIQNVAIPLDSEQLKKDYNVSCSFFNHPKMEDEYLDTVFTVCHCTNQDLKNALEKLKSKITIGIQANQGNVNNLVIALLEVLKEHLDKQLAKLIE